MIKLPPIPDAIAKLPRDERGYPVPWFVPWLDGRPEFLAADSTKIPIAIKNRQCWICGDYMHLQEATFVLGPMGATNRVNSEPPSHWECAVFAATACPFLIRPKMKRREIDHPTFNPRGHVDHHPGASCLWQSPEYELVGHGKTMLIEIGEATRIAWYCEGKPATRQQVVNAIDEAKAILMEGAAAMGRRVEMKQQIRELLTTVPQA
jgi:hypothetical protein